MTARYLGIDVSSGGRPFTYALVSGSAHIGPPNEGVSGVLEVGFIAGAADIAPLVAHLAPAGVAIDCPSGLPTGLQPACCLQTPAVCGCTITAMWGGAPATMRQCEHEVRALGMSVYPTNKNSPAYWKHLVSAMLPVWTALGTRPGLRLLETYPYAVWRRLFPASSFAWTGGVKNDTYDAILCAMVAELEARGQAQALGAAAEGRIVLPN